MALEYTNEIIIHQPRQKVVELMSNPENMKHWQKGFVAMEPVSGDFGAEGSKSRLRYKMGKRDVELIETITRMNFPDEFNAIYEAKNVYNEQKNRFYALEDGNTKWVSDSMFKFSGGMKIMGWLMPGAFKKQSCKFMEDFKAFAEGVD